MRKTVSWLYFALIFVFLYAPIAIMILYSFNDASGSVTKWGGFGFGNYLGLLNQTKAIESLRNSLVIALLSSIGACLLGTMASLGLVNLKKSRGVVLNISNLPIINPEIVTGVSLMLIFSVLFSGVGLGFHTVLLAHIVFNTPYVILNVMPRLRRMDKNLYEAALDLGCTPTRALWRVVMPELFPAILSGFLISFTYSMDDFVISYYTGGTFQTFSVFIYNSLKKGLQDWMLALSGILFVSVLCVLILMNVHDIRQEKKEKNAR